MRICERRFISNPVSCSKKKRTVSKDTVLFFFGAQPCSEVRISPLPLRSAQNRGPLDLVRPSSCTLCPGGEILVNVHDSDSCARAGLRVRLPSWVFRCDATTGNGPVLKTGDPRRRTGGSSPSHSALQTWLNWQKHFPAKEGPGDRHAGSRPAVCVILSAKTDNS